MYAIKVAKVTEKKATRKLIKLEMNVFCLILGDPVNRFMLNYAKRC